MVRLRVWWIRDNEFFLKFQFQYGTIESKTKVQMLGIVFNFNSSMVRLRGYEKHNNPRSIYLFQFQYGTIERWRIHRHKTIRKPFQFQYGTIESWLNLIKPLWLCWFQFQYGTIERSNGFKYLSRINYFNSSMVRLRGLCRISWKKSMSNFNSSMVRLRVDYRNNI